MNDQDQVSVKALFSEDITDIGKKMSELEGMEAVTAIKDSFLEKAAGVKWSDLFAEVCQGAQDLLNIKIKDILIGAWQKHKEIKKYADREKYSPGETVLCPLTRHKVKSIHHPSVEILVNDHTLGRMVFDLVLLFDLEGFILKIRDARIVEILTGSCRGSGTFRYDEVVLLKKESGKIPMPGSISLGEGIPII